MNRLYGVVTESGSKAPIVDALVSVAASGGATVLRLATRDGGRYEALGLVDGDYTVTASAFGRDSAAKPVNLAKDSQVQANLAIALDAAIHVDAPEEGGTRVVVEGTRIGLDASFPGDPARLNYLWAVSRGVLVEQGDAQNAPTVHWDTTGLPPGLYRATLTISEKGSAALTVAADVLVRSRVVAGAESTPVVMRRTATTPTTDLPLWVLIRHTTEEIGFDSYLRFIDLLLCGIDEAPDADAEQKAAVRQKFGLLREVRALPYNDVDAYRLLKVATEAFLMVKCGVVHPIVLGRRHGAPRGFRDFPFSVEDLAEVVRRVSLDPSAVNLDGLWRQYLQPLTNGEEDATIPYLALVREKLGDVRLKNSFFAAEDPHIDLPNAERCFGILRTKLSNPCLIELIWSYWHEEGMLVQTMAVLSLRFQNIRSPREPDPLAMLEIDPLRPLNNLLWGYIQDEQHRLSVMRRAYEYDHHYGLSLYGKAVPALRTADSRSKFLEAFHHLLHLAAIFFKEDDDTTVIADGFPVLNALKEVHYLLAEGAHNQFGDLPSTARQEMLIQQWILARPEFREFLPTRIMVAYPEPWMDRVDAMKRLQGWTDVSVREFHELGEFGEQILLSIRYGSWGQVDDPVQAANWARFWRAEIQGYIHAYRAVTGVDVAGEVGDAAEAARRATPPSVLLRERLALQQRGRPPLGPGTRPALAAQPQRGRMLRP